LIVRDDDLAERGGQILRFRNHPHSCLGPTRACHHACDVIVVEGKRRGGDLTMQAGQRSRDDHGEGNCRERST
jgi:hypothetical protein